MGINDANGPRGDPLWWDFYVEDRDPDLCAASPSRTLLGYLHWREWAALKKCDEAMYSQYLADPEQIPTSWRRKWLPSAAELYKARKSAGAKVWEPRAPLLPWRGALQRLQLTGKWHLILRPLPPLASKSLAYMSDRERRKCQERFLSLRISSKHCLYMPLEEWKEICCHNVGLWETLMN